MSIKTRVCFVLDDSGSIANAGITKDVHHAFNAQLKDISDDAVASGDDVTVTFFLFGETINRELFNVPAKHVRELAKYDPQQGRTKLFEATGKAIETMKEIEKKDGSDCAFLIVVVTDGQNNDFKYSAARLKKEIEQVQRTGHYTLVFMLPPGEKRSFCRDFGISEGNVAEWEQSRKGVSASAQVQKQSFKKYFASRRAGQMSTNSFYSDMSHVSPSDVRVALDDISKHCQVWMVWKDERIDEFCEAMSKRPYIKGAAFYQLVKAEKAVQDYKKILIMEKGKSAIYSGDAARQMLGLPQYSVKLIPGDHANFEIFVQSTSMNRILPENTKVVYYPDAIR